VITVTVDDWAVRAALDRLRSRVADMRPAMTAIGEELVARILDGFKRETDPWGQAWAPLKASTVEGRARRFKTAKAKRAASANPRILQDTGTLRSSIEIQSVDADGVTVGSRVPYAAAHQFGSARKGLPARAFFPARETRADLPPSWLQAIVRQIQTHLEG